MSGSALAATTGLGAVVLLGTAAAGFHDLALIKVRRSAEARRVRRLTTTA